MWIKQSVISVALKTSLKTRLGICIFIISLLHTGPAFRRLLPIGLPAQGGTVLSPLTYESYTFYWSCVVARAAVPSFFMRGSSVNCVVFYILIHHKSFCNCKSSHCFSMCGIVFLIAPIRQRGFLSNIEAVFCFTGKRFLLTRLLVLQQFLPLVFWKLSLFRNYKCVLLSRSFIRVMHFPS